MPGGDGLGGGSTLNRHMHHLPEQGKIPCIANGEKGRFPVSAIEPVPEAALSERQTQAIRLAREAGRLTRQQFADTTSLFLRTASRELAAMVDIGLLTSDGQGGRMSGYILRPA
ncbi:MAG: hypothetical protein HQL55_07770 [Magnetococcales bacterium]|nr:hypothetical protein [Magnetococcales bacterium]